MKFSFLRFPFLTVCLLMFATTCFAQPANDNCANATAIPIGSGGFGLGIFTGTQYDITAATLQSGETFAPGILTAGVSKKSIWYKFSIPTTRSVEVFLKQPTVAIADGNVGFAVYKTSACLPGDAEISNKLTPIAKFASSKHPCLDAGDYYIQVSGNNSANGVIFVSLDIKEPDPAPYDKPATASKFGKVSANKTTAVDFNVECQSIDNASEVCLSASTFRDYTKSTWHTFTTPDYFEWLAVLLSGTTGYYWDPRKEKIGFRLYEGDATVSPVSSLTAIGGCDSIFYNPFYADFKALKCGMLKPNTTYSVQLLYHKNFKEGIRFAIGWDGSSPTRAPQPISGLHPDNKVGTLPSSFTGVTTYLKPDTFACNALHSNYSCPKTLPPAGLVSNPSGYTVKQNMSIFYSFTLANTTELNIYAASGCGLGITVRLYKQALTATCSGLDTINIVSSFIGNNTISCLPAGDYVLQVMGNDEPQIGAINLNQLITGYNGNTGLCIFSNLGKSAEVRITATTQVGINKFSLNKAGAIEKINTDGSGVMQPVQLYKTYTTTPDTLGCENTVLPADDCGVGDPKASYREFVLADSAIFRLEGNAFNWTSLFKGDANALATAQNAFAWPQKINGLLGIRKCMIWNINGSASATCITPGTFSLVSFGPLKGGYSGGMIVQNPSFSVIAPKTVHNSPANAQDMGDLWAKLGPAGGLTASDIDTFSCYDNPAVIDGFDGGSCWGPYKSTKLIYRQFYLDQATSLRIATSMYGYTGYNGYLTLYSGKVTDGTAGLKIVDNWKCFYDKSNQGSCTDLLAAGWYTVIAYGYGGSYENPLQTTDAQGNHYTMLGLANAFYITLYPKTCASPQFNRPYKASVDTLSKKPYLVDWAPQGGHSAAYPVTYKTYTLNTENFDCTSDTAFIRQKMVACPGDAAKVAFYVFQITRESFVQIDKLGGLWASVYDFDVRTSDSTRLKTAQPLQPCMNIEKQLQLCKLQPGYYTLVLFAPSNWNCNSLQPTIYVDQVGYSRFDHASNAYDFGTIKPDSVWRNGKIGDINPLNSSRAPSNDFFYCTTGAQPKDPNVADCNLYTNPEIYKAGNNIALHPDNSIPASYYIDRRNLWYTFTVNQPGIVWVRVTPKTPGKTDMYGYAVFKSDVDGTLPFSNVVSGGLVDSTLAQGLVDVTRNFAVSSCAPNTSSLSAFFTEQCDFKPTRYYIIVDNTNSYYTGGIERMFPANQLEVEVLLDSFKATPVKYDHYSQANNLGVVNSGKKKGAVDNFTCASKDLADPVFNYTTCQKTLWYKFTTTVTGTIRYAAFFKGQYQYYYDNIQLFRDIKPGDSSANGLLHLPLTTTYYDNVNNANWAQQCISPGTYYILLPGCNAVNEDVYPEIEIIPQAGDFCSNPLVASLKGVGSSTATVKVDCHTIGTDYGEFNQTLTCPAGAETSHYKTSWYRIDVSGKDTLDITVYIDEKTNASSTDIKYRMMTGSCGAMQAQSCVQDALTRNTYECMIPGVSYFIQVFTPLTVSGTAVVGDIDLNISAIKHVASCAPANNCIAVAEFFPKFDCTKDRNVSVTNLSTFGADIKYVWDFGYNNQKSTAVSPEFFYPAITTDKTYTITLTVTNTQCGKQDVISKDILIPARPAVNLGNDTVVCNSLASVTLDATSNSGTTYQWYAWYGYWGNYSTNAKVVITDRYSLIAELTYNNCKARDTISVWINPPIKKPLQVLALCNVDKINLSSYRGYGEQYSWSNGKLTNNIDVYTPGYYWCDLYLNGCITRDSFLVINPAVSQQKKSIAICQKAMPYAYDATVSGATAYTWNDNNTNATRSITKPGLYWVDITVSGCSYLDTLVISVDSFKTNNLVARICMGQTYKLPSGKLVSTSGVYKDSLKNIRGCDSSITTVTLKADTVIRRIINTSICAGQSYLLPSGRTINIAGSYADTARYTSNCDSIITNLNLLIATPARNTYPDTICSGKTYMLPSGKIVNTSGTYTDTLKAKAGCDSVINLIKLVVLTAITNTYSTSICSGKTYTLPSGKIINTTGVYKDTTRYKNGCDSLISNVTLTVGNPVKPSKNVSICQGQSYKLPSGLSVNTSGVYNDTLHTVAGCDSLISTVTLNVQTVAAKTITDFICAGKNYALPSGKLVSSSGVFTDTLRYSSGCDSIRFTVNLTVYPVIVNNNSITICSGKTYTLPSSKIITSSGVYKDTIRYKNGCDSLISNVTLSIVNPFRTSKNVIICEGQVYTLPSGSVINSPGVYNDTIRSVAGCDSLITSTTLSVDIPQKKTIQASICNNKFYSAPSGKLLNVAGVYNDTIRNRRGCDSVLFTINLQILSPIVTNISATVCSGDLYVLPGGKKVSGPGNYGDTLRSVTGCDSIINTQLSVMPLPTVNAGNDTLVMVGSIIPLNPVYGGNIVKYTWTPTDQLSCSTCSTPVANPLKEITYTITVENSFQCKASDSKTIRLFCNSESVFVPNTFTPNADGINDIWYPRGNGIQSIKFLRVFNRWGQLVFERNNFSADDRGAGWDGTLKGQKLPADVFVYSLGMICSNGEIVETKGNVMIVR